MAFVAVVVAIVMGLVLANLRERALTDMERQLQNNALAIAAQTDHAFQTLELVQKRLLERIQTLGLSSREDYERMSGYDVHLMLADRTSGLPHVNEFSLIDANGNLVNTSGRWPVRNVNLSHRDFVRFFRSDTVSSSYIGEPVLNAATKTRTIAMSRRVTSSNGEFLGLIAGAMELEYFEAIFKRIVLGSDGAITIFRHDGVLLVRQPRLDSPTGQRFQHIAEVISHSDHGVVRQIDPIDGKERVLAVASLSHYPVVVTVSTTLSAALADWRNQAQYLIGLAIVLLVVIGGIGVMVVRSIRRKNSQLDTALNNMHHALLMYDCNDRVLVVNQRYIDMYRLSSHKVKPGCTLREVLEQRSEAGTFNGDIDEHVTREQASSHDEDKIIDTPDGRMIAKRNRRTPDGGWVSTMEDITERKRAEERIAYLAHHDPLTDLPNRTAFNEYIASTMEQALAVSESFALLTVDLDRFKDVNDVFGHAVGDALLRDVGCRLQEAAKGSFVARTGGDEFALILTDAPQPATAAAMAERLQSAFANDFEIQNRRLRVGLSTGIALFPPDASDAPGLIRNADAALYRAKAEGRGEFRFFAAEMDKHLQERRVLQHDLKSAISRGDLFLHYQPQARTGGEITGFEALVRWQHPVRGMVPPADFIPLAEQSGLILEIGEYVLREACREAASWSRPLQIAVNLSPIQFRHGDLAGLVLSVLLETGLPADRLELEITEGVLIEDFAHAVSILRRLKSLGVRIAMDDFGTGYSSLSYLQSFPFDKIKIDQSFISKAEQNAQSAAIVRAVIGLGRGLGLPVLAEGVETEAQLEFLALESCDEVQGYFVGRPGPIENYAELIGRSATLELMPALVGKNC